jgi:hypothetical protein
MKDIIFSRNYILTHCTENNNPIKVHLITKFHWVGWSLSRSKISIMKQFNNSKKMALQVFNSAGPGT